MTDRSAELLAAIEGYDVDAVRALLAEGSFGASLAEALREASSLSEDYLDDEIVAIVDALLAEGAPVDAAGEHGRTPLIRAVQAGKAITVARLLAAGADPAVESSLGTALEIARRAHRRIRSDEVIALLEGAAKVAPG